MGRQVPLVRADLDHKHAEMAASLFPFLRATYYRWAELFPATCPDCAPAPAVLGVGDLHVENFGTWRDAEGRLVWGVNDFDEADHLPYTNDLVRLATSVLVATREGPIALPFKQACQHLLAGYTEGLERGGRPVVLEEGYAVLRRQALPRLRNPSSFWAGLDALPPQGRPPAGAVKALAALLPAGHGERDLRRRRAGLGSLGHPRIVAVATWHGSRIAREAKGCVGPATTWLAAPDDAHPPILGQRAIDGAVRCPDPFLRIRDGWCVRRLAPDCARVELDSVPTAKDQDEWLHAMGWETANVHAGTASAVPAVLQDLRGRPWRWLRDAAVTMAKACRADHREWAARRNVSSA